MLAQRIISGLVIIAYITTSSITGGLEAALRTAAYCLLPLFAIWFPLAMGSWKGTRMNAPSITQSSPGCLVQFMGWMMLSVPVFVTLILKYGV